MRLFIDLNKAQSQIASTSVDTPTEDQTVAEDKSSYSRRYEGVASGEALDPDRPDVGAKWQHTDENANTAEVKTDRKKRTKEAKGEGLVAKSFSADAIEYMEGLNKSLELEQAIRSPNPREREFLTEVLGFSHEEVNKGIAVITGRNRALFNRWLCDKLSESTYMLKKSLGVNFE